MSPRLIFSLVVLLLLVVATAHVLASERAATEPCERGGSGRTGGAQPPDSILRYVVPAGV